MNRDTAITLLDQLHGAQNRFYSGDETVDFSQVLSPTVTWTVPGNNAIAGTYRGVEQVIDYFHRRRDIANATFKMTRRDVLVGDGDRVTALTDGSAVIHGTLRTWSTVGLYDFVDGKVAACWLLPLDSVEFDTIWSTKE